MWLEGKVAVIYGGGGPIGGAAARAFAREGATVYLAGRTLAKLDAVAADIGAAGGRAHTAVVDALDEQAVDRFVDGVVAEAGRVDISFNVISFFDVVKPLLEISVSDFVHPIEAGTRTQFLTTRAAVRHMVPRGSGVVLTFGGNGPQTAAGLGGFQVALDAISGLRRQWAIELGQHGIRFVTIKTGGVPETFPAETPGREAMVAQIVEASPMKRAATLADVGNVAAFLASDLAGTITDTEINIACGAMPD